MRADASLEEVARRAGKDRVAALCAKADELLAEDDPGRALSTWLHAVGAHAVANRGVGSSLTRDGDPALGGTCPDVITTAAGDRHRRRTYAVTP